MNIICCVECNTEIEYDDAVYENDDTDCMLCIKCFSKL